MSLPRLLLVIVIVAEALSLPKDVSIKTASAGKNCIARLTVVRRVFFAFLGCNSVVSVSQ